jgi:hypothetical protein
VAPYLDGPVTGVLHQKAARSSSCIGLDGSRRLIQQVFSRPHGFSLVLPAVNQRAVYRASKAI